MYPDYPEGAPCWADARLPDVEAAKRFYGDLFGWTFDEGAGAERGYYTAAYGEDRAVAALAPGTPAGWTVHFAVRDAYVSADQVTGAGGIVAQGPLSDGAVATVALAAGPEGAPFGLWQAGSHQGFERTGAPGAVSRVELHTPEPEVSDPFYETVFGYETPLGGESDPHTAGDGRAAGPRPWRPRATPAPPGRTGIPDLARRHVAGVPARFLLHFGTADAARGCAEAVRLGGHVRVAPYPTPYGRIAVLADDQNAVFALWEPTGG